MIGLKVKIRDRNQILKIFTYIAVIFSPPKRNPTNCNPKFSRSSSRKLLQTLPKAPSKSHKLTLKKGKVIQFKKKSKKRYLQNVGKRRKNISRVTQIARPSDRDHP